MKRIILFFISLFVVCSSTSKVLATGDTLKTTVLSPRQLQADFNYLRQLLVETHPGLYRYNSNEKMQAKMDSLYQGLQVPLPYYDFYRMICWFVSEIHCAHTNAVPASDVGKFLRQQIKTLPFFIYPIKNRSYVVFNGTSDQTILPGFELVRINGHKMDSISRIIRRHFWGDGYIEISKDQALQGHNFGLFYYTLIERPDSFRLTFRDPTGKEITKSFQAQFAGLTDSQFAKNPVNANTMKLYNKKYKTSWRLSFPEDVKSTALLRFDGFGAKGIRSGDDARAAMRKFMDESIKKISQQKSGNLIVDVRSNGGGWDAMGIELLTYLVSSDEPFRFYNPPRAVTDSSSFFRYSDLSAEDLRNVKKELKKQDDGSFIAREEGNEDLALQTPKPNRFKGKIYVLINGRSASAASEFAAVAKSNSIGVFVGEEAGGTYEGGNGGSFIHVDLPNSKIRIGTPLLAYDNAVSTPTEKGRGTMPDHVVAAQPEDLVNGYDRQMEFVKELIRKEK